MLISEIKFTADKNHRHFKSPECALDYLIKGTCTIMNFSQTHPPSVQKTPMCVFSAVDDLIYLLYAGARGPSFQFSLKVRALKMGLVFPLPIGNSWKWSEESKKQHLQVCIQ